MSDSNICNLSLWDMVDEDTFFLDSDSDISHPGNKSLMHEAIDLYAYERHTDGSESTGTDFHFNSPCKFSDTNGNTINFDSINLDNSLGNILETEPFTVEGNKKIEDGAIQSDPVKSIRLPPKPHRTCLACLPNARTKRKRKRRSERSKAKRTDSQAVLYIAPVQPCPSADDIARLETQRRIQNNRREHERRGRITHAFQALRIKLPDLMKDKKSCSKLEILRSATTYIQELNSYLATGKGLTPSQLDNILLKRHTSYEQSSSVGIELSCNEQLKDEAAAFGSRVLSNKNRQTLGKEKADVCKEEAVTQRVTKTIIYPSILRLSTVQNKNGVKKYLVQPVSVTAIKPT